jgi:tetratricopeptide (TPR) repeat protein
MVKRGCCLAIALVVGTGARADAAEPVTAAPPSALEARELEAQKACLTGQYQHGIEILAELYIATEDANYLYNQGRCFQQNGHFDEAITRFREYQRKARDVSAEELAEVQRQIDDCQRSRQPTPAQVVVPPPPRLDLEATASPAPGRFRRVGTTMIAIGLVSLVAALVAGAEVQAFQKDVVNQYDRGKHLWGPRLEALQWAGYGLGAVALGLGTTFYFARF